MSKLPKSFYQRSAAESVKDFLGKYLVYQSPKGKVSGKIVDVEAYPVGIDNVSHGNKRTKRTEVMYADGGFAYVYLIYGMYYQFAIVVNQKDVPEVVFVRAVIPDQGVEIMRQNFGREVNKDTDMTKSPGNLCKAFGITLALYGEDLTGDTLYVEDRGDVVAPETIQCTKRVGINQSVSGHDLPWRFFIA